MAFKNFDVAKKYAVRVDEEKTEAVSEKEESEIKTTTKNVATKKVDSSVIKVEIKSIPAKKRKSLNLNIRVTEETKTNIENLAKKFGISQSDLITMLVNTVIKQNNLLGK